MNSLSSPQTRGTPISIMNPQKQKYFQKWLNFINANFIDFI